MRLRWWSTPLLVAALLCSACSSTPGSSVGSSTSASAAPAASASSGPSGQPGASGSGESLCTSTRSGDTATPGAGTLSGKIDQGRLLFGLEGGGGAPSGTFAYAIVDPSGIHVTPTTDWTMAHAVWSPSGGIVFDSERADDRHLFHMADDGTGVVQLTSEFRVAQQDPTFAGSGHLVFDEYGCSEPRDLGLHVASADGSHIVDLTPDQPIGSDSSDSHATVSPDGSTVVFVRTIDPAGSTGSLFRIPIAGGTAARLIPDTAGIAFPRFSPDGKTILFTANDANGDPSLWSVPVAGGTPTQRMHLAAGTYAFKGEWSPDGSEIVYTYYQRGWDHNALHLIAADGTADRELWMGSLSTAEDPAWER